MKNLIVLVLILTTITAVGQEHSHRSSRPLTFPDIPGYKSIKTDLHMHTVFSDGNVWPNIRVQEALRDNLDVISLTEHLEYQPHSKDIPHPDRNRSYKIALQEAKDHDLLIVHGSEITRDAPMGHNNAVFIEDANPILQDKAENAFAEAKKQNAFVFWNHPAWYAQNPDGNPILSEFQKERINKGELHGIEVINMTDYAEESLALALENNLTIMGTSDVHGLIDWDYTEKGNHRPITLVFTKEKSIPSVKEALFAGRTVAVYNDLMVGREEFLAPLLQASLKVESATYAGNSNVLEIELTNITSSDLLFQNESAYTFYDSSPVFEISAGETKMLHLKTLERKSAVDLKLRALGCFVAPKIQPVVTWTFNPSN
ncbi:Sb-PDE family phosphodiesterase [Maribacter sp. PR1]|uniref:Sb-PDE family phosphodiesterase n=1 Tax=Maribacter cobaltidurans TaxID=1178778 RepID=A0ABU7ING8_9FLAO|nr:MULTISPECIES: Sb-PDE family phosphodiesterase [Maribacter]MDC6387128.1 Sb-PDE family phosphodiesterase [Maribacter sp. PR1]MEE1974514.1 Sb-PDE family phosphodiesterase [Maribacter cobaltidurans]